MQEQAATSCYCPKPRHYFGKERKLGPLTVQLRGYNDSPIENLSSCIVFLILSNKKYRVLCKVTNNKGHIIFSREQSLKMKDMDFPSIYHANSQCKTRNHSQNSQMLAHQVTSQSSGTVNPAVKRMQHYHHWKDAVANHYERVVVKEYADMFRGIGVLPGGSYDIHLNNYKQVQNLLCQVAVSSKPAYRAELDTFQKLDVSTEVK